MFSQLRMREEQALLAHDYALETARAEGIEQGLERGKVEGSLSMLLNLVRQGLLPSEVASQQLGKGFIPKKLQPRFANAILAGFSVFF